MPEVTVTLEDVESKDVNTKRGLSTVYRLKGSDGRTYTTFDDKLAKEGAKYRGQTVVLDYVESKNGEYTNYNLNGVAAAVETGSPISTPPVVPALTPSGPAASNDKELSIARAVALKAAVETVVGSDSYDTQAQSPDDLIINLANDYVSWLLTGEKPPVSERAESLVQF